MCQGDNYYDIDCIKLSFRLHFLRPSSSSVTTRLARKGEPTLTLTNFKTDVKQDVNAMLAVLHVFCLYSNVARGPSAEKPKS
jgi:hypothetical protein